jgi:hypothetical protein
VSNSSDDLVIPIGIAKVMGEYPISPDAQHAMLILNMRLNERGYLDSTQRKMHLIPPVWNNNNNPTPWGGGVSGVGNGVLGMGYIALDGGVRPEIVFVTRTGIFRYAAWTRSSGSLGFRGLEEILEYRFDGATTSSNSVVQRDPFFPPQFEALGNRLYMTFGDGGGAWVWDGERLRRFGYTERPNPPDAIGPARDSDNKSAVNNGGFPAKGRIGTLDPFWTRSVEVSYNASGVKVDKAVGTDNYLQQEPVGGIKNGRWQYYRCWENVDGAYSPMSAAGAVCTIRRRAADPDDSAADGGLVIEKLRKRFWTLNLQQGPPGTVATILLRTANLEYLPTGDSGLPRFLHRVPGNVATEYIDDIPDGELGGVWVDREPIPSGFYFLRHFDGSMFIMRSDGHPSRVWWTEQTGPYGPIPESVLAGHWRDVYPETGPITGSIVTRPAVGDGGSIMLIGKRQAMHYMAPSYPQWERGTLHSAAGLDGPNLIQACPDGSVVWYGNNTFWLFDPTDGVVRDVGDSIRETLKKVNVNRSAFGASWVDKSQGEVRFALPLEDANSNDRHFIWDYRMRGFRMADDLIVDASLVVPGSDIVLLSGSITAPPGVAIAMGTNPSVWIYGRGYPVENYRQREAIYRSGWVPAPGAIHHFFHGDHLVCMLEERHWQDITVRAYADWSLDEAAGATNRTDTDDLLRAHHPENDNIKFAAGATPAAPAARRPTFGVAKWRERRPYSHQVAVGAESVEVLCVELSMLYPTALYNINAYGPVVATPVGRTPAR